MDAIKAEIERKKNQLAKAQVVTGDKKYFKRGDLAAKQEEEYWKKHKRAKLENEADLPQSSLETSKLANAAELSKTESAEATSKPTLSRKEVKKTENLARKKVIRRLRERNEPILLFGEVEYEAYQRLKKLELLEPEVNKGYKNDLKAAMDKVDQQYLNELSMGSESSARNAYNVIVKETGMVEDEMVVMAEELGQGDHNKDQANLMKFLKFILQKWGDDLNSRPEEVKKSRQGKIDAATHSQTVSYMKPLFKSFKNRSCSADILVCLVDVCKHMLVRDYISANEAYMEMAIGNAPWPIGVTMVGIHARTGREKIFDKNVAHVLNDETQRKYIQAVKRLMTRCQKYFPGQLSRMVNYERPSKQM